MPSSDHGEVRDYGFAAKGPAVAEAGRVDQGGTERLTEVSARTIHSTRPRHYSRAQVCYDVGVGQISLGRLG
jgi:hypothetical protein